jgi:hypothetical protein
MMDYSIKLTINIWMLSPTNGKKFIDAANAMINASTTIKY